MLAERGIDLDDLGSFGAIFAVIFAMIDPDFSKEMMAKMDGLNQSTPTTTTLTTTTTPTTTPTDPEVTASTDADASVVAGNEQEPEEVVENDLGGVNGNAVTVVVDNSANGAQPVVDHDSGSVTLNGASVVSRFNEDLVNPDNATSVDAMVDSNVVVGIPPFDFSLAGNEVSELGF